MLYVLHVAKYINYCCFSYFVKQSMYFIKVYYLMLKKYISKVQYVGIFQKLSLNNSSDVVTSVYCAGDISAEASMLTS